MSWKERLKMAWRMLTHKSRGHEFWGCVQVTDTLWGNADWDIFVLEVFRECNDLSEDMRRTIVGEWQASRRA